MFFKRKLNKAVKKVNEYENLFRSYTDEELKAKTLEFKQKIKEGISLDHLLPEAFAVVREAADRVVGMRHYDVQVMGGYVLHQGDIAEMRTGEGKTLVETLPAYLNALEGKGVHIVTVNDYLAKRDKEWMGQIFEFLGLSVGLIQSNMEPEERKIAYAKDITYVTNHELGFDFLRDNMAKEESHKVLRGLYYAIVDEVDSILIDEARTPLIISGLAEPSVDLYHKADAFAKSLTVGERKEPKMSKIEQALLQESATETGDVIVDRKEKRVHLTEEGVKKAEAFFGMENIGDVQYTSINHHINQALKANYLFKKDVDYIIRDGKIEIVDEFTGRVLKGRMYSEGLHQAIEAKEGVDISPESKTLASITYQNLFRMYKKLSGMTGTAKTEEEEFRELYNMLVRPIPTNNPPKRIDLNDTVFITQEEKYDAIIEDICECFEKKRPVLVGTTNIEVSELISARLKKKNIPHTVLNAKHHEKEAEIIAEAGQIGAVTVATNMAGRGTDILVTEEAKALGGLKVIGTERHESRRIDNQLRGRTGRQGDPGESVFYLSLEDDLLKLFGAQNYMNIFQSLSLEKGTPIKHPLITKAVERAQKTIESVHYSARKYVMEYDNIVNLQRKTIYEDRDRLFQADIPSLVLKISKSEIEQIVQKHSTEQEDVSSVKKVQQGIYILTGMALSEELLKTLDAAGIYAVVEKEFLKRIEPHDKNKVQDVCRHVAFTIVDRAWSGYIDEVSQLQKEIQLQAYGQKDPLVEFNIKSHELFNYLVHDIQMRLLRTVFRIKWDELLKEE